MKVTPHLLLVLITFTGLFIFACGNLGDTVTPAQVAPLSSIHVDTPVPVQPTPIHTVTPALQTFAPACAPCAAPIIEDTEANQTYCTKKIPYQNFSVEPGTTFEPLDPSGEGKCFDSGTVRVVNGKSLKVWTCTGRQLWTYELKVTSPPCSSRMVLELNSDRCEAGLLYSAAQNCCISLTGGEQLFVIVKVNMGACR